MKKKLIGNLRKFIFRVDCTVLYLGSNDSVNVEDLATVRNVMSGAAPLGAMDIDRLHKK